MPDQTFTVKTSNIILESPIDGEKRRITIRCEDGTSIQALFPDLNRYSVIVDDEPIFDSNAISRMLTMSPYNHYECLLRSNGETIIVNTIVIRNSLLGDEVLHRINFGM